MPVGEVSGIGAGASAGGEAPSVGAGMGGVLSIDGGGRVPVGCTGCIGCIGCIGCCMPGGGIGRCMPGCMPGGGGHCMPGGGIGRCIPGGDGHGC